MRRAEWCELESLISNAGNFTNEQIKLFLEETITRDAARKILDGIAKQTTVLEESELPGEQVQNWTVPIGKVSSVEEGKG